MLDQHPCGAHVAGMKTPVTPGSGDFLDRHPILISLELFSIISARFLLVSPPSVKHESLNMIVATALAPSSRALFARFTSSILRPIADQKHISIFSPILSTIAESLALQPPLHAYGEALGVALEYYTVFILTSRIKRCSLLFFSIAFSFLFAGTRSDPWTCH
ncbi:hypothetical protein K443DRAFT_480016 [Laccaria amethystina LaAM-08-1]|uniref:Uncharacterized protein n=1 Tax=Laccaria amethystina LaAM-08-1 TaxID=1095629 RepID=A0A0C9XP98_9AGAR|nr:hypothetical protein K443DRAFT_480016 [Laccaria amethystina LaAM-08-1]